ncbi:transposase [Saccharopolyspora sp. ASAGF58]|uniref:transposase n=1 Tax=Saccharopolyspora sp. ASAGF58 TaxID=2719023 RepID=UPI00144601DA|nr:transposase [Saccharopolyspora sp. ASAGF58]
MFTAPTFATFASLVTGLLAATGPRTVTGMWSAAGLAGRCHHARAHRFFSHARWSLDSLGLLLARLVVAASSRPGKP